MKKNSALYLLPGDIVFVRWTFPDEHYPNCFLIIFSSERLISQAWGPEVVYDCLSFAEKNNDKLFLINSRILREYEQWYMAVYRQGELLK